MSTQVFIKIFGHVQGVFFRRETQAVARGLGLKGWVRNAPDGGVEICAQGPEDKLKILTAWCGRGPERARVENVHVIWQHSENELKDFAII